MRSANIAVDEKELYIIYGNMDRPDPPRELALASVKYLYTDLTDIRKYYIRLGFHLHEFERMNYCKDFGYPSFWDFCEINLGLDKSAASRCINVYLNFNVSLDHEFRNGCKIRGSAMDLSEKWKDYSYTQLCEILPLSKEERKGITPDMTVKQIREYKRNLKNKQDISVCTSEETDEDGNAVASTQQKKFDYDKCMSLKGIAQRNYVKNCIPLELCNLCVFDNDGKKVFSGCFGEVLERKTEANDCRLVMRVHNLPSDMGNADTQKPDDNQRN